MRVFLRMELSLLILKFFFCYEGDFVYTDQYIHTKPLTLLPL